MSQYVPDNTTVYEADEDNLIQALKGNTITSGGAVTAQSVPDMTVQFAAAYVKYGASNNLLTANAALAIAAADPTNIRIDLVHLPSGGGAPVAVITGTPATTPKPPALPSTSILVAYVSVAAAATNIQSSNISDRRLIVGEGVVRSPGTPLISSVPAGSLLNNSNDGTLNLSDGVNWYSIVTNQPNLVLNSDFARRTVFGLAMPEMFADTSGLVVVSGSGGVAANLYTTGANTEIAWCNQLFVWRDGRASFTWKAVSTTDRESLFWRIDAANFVELRQSGGTLTLRKTIAGVDTQLATVANALTINRYYWGELEKQGTTFILKVYDTGGTIAGVTKASSTLLQTLTGTAADAAVAVGAHISIFTATNGGIFGGIATGNGGVYVETWLPESWTFDFTGGTGGGHAVGFDESADSGPLTKQWALRVYIPNASRMLAMYNLTPDGSVVSSTAYTASFYLKTSGKGGSGALVNGYFAEDNSAGGDISAHIVADASEAAWTRKTISYTTGGTTRRQRSYLLFNTSGSGSPTSATGTAFIQLPQLEQGSAATAWRNAPADDAPIVWSLTSGANDVLAADGEINSRDLAANIFLPWDATLTVHVSGVWANSGANADYVQINVGGTKTIVAALNGTTVASFAGTISKGTLTGLSVGAGKTRVPLLTARAAGTVTFYGSTYAQTNMTIVATRGK